MKKLALFILLVLSAAMLSLGGCGYKEATLNPDQKAYLWFSGKTEGVSAFVDDQGPIDLGPRYYTDSMGNKQAKTSEIHYEIEPGKHRVKLVRDGQTILDRIFLIGNHMTREIEVP
ncbi:hypothetical protein [Desulfocurvus sp. DL9XJH121]